MSSTRYLRPPYPMFRILAACLMPFVFFVAWQMWSHRLPELQAFYLADYAKVSFVPDVSFDLDRILSPRQGSAKPREMQPALCYTILGHELLAMGTQVDFNQHPHVCAFAATQKMWAVWLQQRVYGRPLFVMLWLPGTVALVLCAALFGWGWILDQERHLAFRTEGRYIRGPLLVSRGEFRRQVKGSGIGWKTEAKRDVREWLLSLWTAGQMALYGSGRMAWAELFRGAKAKLLCIEEALETQHTQIIGDTGSGKTLTILQITDAAEELGETCVIYDPHREFIRRYFNAERGDVILNPTDARCAHWNPSDEIDYTDATSADSTALAQAASMYPGNPQRKDWFFVDACRRIWRHCMVHYRPDAQELAQLFTHANPLIDSISKGTDLEEMLKENADSQRAGITGSLTAPAFALRQIPGTEDGRPTWSARKWAERRQGWIFLTSTQESREALRPVQSLWLDSLILRLLSMGKVEGAPRVRMILDELPTLQELGQLKPALSESRKSGLTIVIGFQGRSDIKAIYGEEAEGIFSAPYTKFILRTGEPEAAKWASQMLGDREMERVREHRGAKGERTYTTEQKVEPIVMPSELAGLANRHGYLRYGKYVVPIKMGLIPQRGDLCEGYVQRLGMPIAQLPMPNLEEIRRKEEEERKAKAAEAAAYVYRPKEASGEQSAKKKRGPAGQE